MKRLVVLDVVGLTPGLLGADTPHLSALGEEGFRAQLDPVLPAVTCTAQASMVTGRPPSEHGIVANGWYFRDLAQVWLWRQSNHLVHGERVWETGRGRDPAFTCAKLFWWFNLYSTVDWSVTPRPAYFADGRKLSDVYTEPPELRDSLTGALGAFPLFEFWGPKAGIGSSRWIAAAASRVLTEKRPTLSLVYLPHLDYDLQRFGPDDPRIPAEVRRIDAVCGELIAAARRIDAEVIALSEYGITPVRGSISLNRILRESGFLRVHSALNGELLDAGGSRAFAVCDHQIAHVYVADSADRPAVRRLLESVDGIAEVLDEDAQASAGLRHDRSGEFVAIAAADRWFDYYYWLDERRAPDFARTVDIHQKPGYDPVELLIDPAKKMLGGRVAAKIAARRLGFRTLFDVIPLDSSLIRGSHGRLPASPEEGPVLLSSSRAAAASRLAMTDVANVILETIFSP